MIHLKHLSKQDRWKTLKLTLAIGVLPLLFAGCRYNGNVSGIHWFLDMHDQAFQRSQRDDLTTIGLKKGDKWTSGADSNPAWTGAGSTMRVPPEGSVPMNYEPYLYLQGEIDLAGKELNNPLPVTQEVIDRGKKQYTVYCAVCHGPTGLGDGNVTPMIQVAFDLKNGPSKNWPDGSIFHMITMGRNMMKPYAAQINVEDRWAIVHYLRLLQKDTPAEAKK